LKSLNSSQRFVVLARRCSDFSLTYIETRLLVEGNLKEIGRVMKENGEVSQLSGSSGLFPGFILDILSHLDESLLNVDRIFG